MREGNTVSHQVRKVNEFPYIEDTKQILLYVMRLEEDVVHICKENGIY
jgi:hypothetical protein